jgi:tetratricopeptide (TPR) repeat protein
MMGKYLNWIIGGAVLMIRESLKVLLLTVFFVVVTACSEDTSYKNLTKNLNGKSGIEDSLKQAIELIDKNRFDEAKAILVKCIEQDPKNGIYNYYLGNVYRRQDDLDSALKQYITAIEKSPAIKEAYNNATAIYMYKKDLNKALEFATNGLNVDSQFAELIMKKGQILYLKEQYKEAIQVLSALSSDPKYFDAERFIGLCYFKMSNKEEAIKHFNKYIKIAPEGLVEKEQVKLFVQQLKNTK